MNYYLKHYFSALCPLCEHGQCTSPNSCSCDSGWTGSNCNQGTDDISLIRIPSCNDYYFIFLIAAVCSYGCAQGVCDFPDFCKCDSDFIGATCDTCM